MKSKVLVSSILTIALCLSLIAGSTFALFTDQTQFGIEVTSGDVEIYASAGIKAVYSAKGPVAEHDDPFLKDENGNYYEHEEQTNYVEKDGKIVTGYFANDGDATITGANLALNKVTPGDRVDVQINIDNRSDVAIAYRYKITAADTNLAKGMVVTIDDVPYTGLNSWTSAWFYADTTEQVGNDIATKVISIELPVYAGNEYQSEHAGNQYYEKDAEGNLVAKTYEKDVIQSVNYTILVEAVQGNAVTDNSSKVDLMVYDADTLAKVLKSNFNRISVKLGKDIDAPVSAFNKFAGEQTEAVNIDLNGYKLNLKTTYNSVVSAKNENAIVTIKNGSMNSTGNSAKTWDIYDIIFENCNYAFENVTFDKEVALCNTGKTVDMKDVTINGTGNYYALWIQAEGQTVNIDGLTVNTPGRGIKIDEEYVAAPAKVTLNVSNAKFDTSVKAAIMVKSAAGADIALNNVDIANTPDTVHAVWVDEDSKAYVDLVTVAGGEKYYEGDVVSSAADLGAAIANGATEIVLGIGNYSMPTTSSDVTIVGGRDTVITVDKPKANKVSFKGVTVVGSGNYTGIQHSNTVVYEDCLIKGVQFLYADKVVFNNCTIDLTEKADYIWTYSAKNVEFNNCTFNTLGKAILIYSEGKDLVTNVSVNGCTFNATASALAGGNVAAAIEIDSSLSKNGHYTLTTNNNTVDPDFSGEWRIKKSGADNTTVNGVVYNAITLDGKRIAYTAADLQKALDNATDGLVVYFANDIAGDVVVPMNPDVKITIDGNGYNFAGVLTVNGKSATYKTSGLTVKNVVFKADSISADACIRFGQGIKNDPMRYVCNVTVDNCTFDVKGAVGVKSYTGGDYNVVIKNCVATENAHSLAQLKGVTGVLVEGCTVNSVRGINLNNSNEVTIQNSTFDVQKYAVRFGESANSIVEEYAVTNCTIASENAEGDAAIVLRAGATNANLDLTNTTINAGVEMSGHENANITK